MHLPQEPVPGLTGAWVCLLLLLLRTICCTSYFVLVLLVAAGRSAMAMSVTSPGGALHICRVVTSAHRHRAALAEGDAPPRIACSDTGPHGPAALTHSPVSVRSVCSGFTEMHKLPNLVPHLVTRRTWRTLKQFWHGRVDPSPCLRSLGTLSKRLTEPKGGILHSLHFPRPAPYHRHDRGACDGMVNLRGTFLEKSKV